MVAVTHVFILTPNGPLFQIFHNAGEVSLFYPQQTRYTIATGIIAGMKFNPRQSKDNYHHYT
jgi:hypothetical protein